MTAFSQAVAGQRPVEVSVRVPMRGDLLAELDRLSTEYREAQRLDVRTNGEDRAPAIGRRMQEIREEMAESEVEFVFRAVGRERYRQLVRENPPSADEKEEAEKAGLALYFGDSFPPALLNEACVSPAGSTHAEWVEIWKTWSDGQVAKLWRECIGINSGSAETPPKSAIAFAAPAEFNLS